MKLLKNNSGMTLVEVIVSVLVLAIVVMMLASGFAGAANMTNRATLFRNASVTTSSSLEVEEAVESDDSQVSVTYDCVDATEDIKMTYKKGSKEGTLKQGGQYASANDSGTGLTYREFYPDNFSFNVPATPVENK